jgi:hypothetical protein
MEFLPVAMDNETFEHFDCNDHQFEENCLAYSNNSEQEDSLDTEYPLQPVMFVKVEALDIDEDGNFISSL